MRFLVTEFAAIAGEAEHGAASSAASQWRSREPSSRPGSSSSTSRRARPRTPCSRGCGVARERARATPARSTRSRPASSSFFPGGRPGSHSASSGWTSATLTEIDLTRADLDRRPRGRRRRGAGAAVARRPGRRARRAFAARSSCRFPPRPRSRSAVSGPTVSTAGASPSRCLCAARGSTRSSSSRMTARLATLDLRVSSGTYVRSIADALGGHCRTLRRTEVGPFRVDEADPERIISCRRRARASRSRAREAGRMYASVAARAAAPRRRRSARSTASTVGTRQFVGAAVATGLGPQRSPSTRIPAIVLGNQVELVTTLERRLELLAAGRGGRPPSSPRSRRS